MSMLNTTAVRYSENSGFIGSQVSKAVNVIVGYGAWATQRDARAVLMAACFNKHTSVITLNRIDIVTEQFGNNIFDVDPICIAVRKALTERAERIDELPRAAVSAHHGCSALVGPGRRAFKGYAQIGRVRRV